MPFDECSAAMGFQVKEIKRQSRAVKVTHPPAGGGNFTRLRFATPWQASAMKRQRNETTSQARLPGIGEDVKKTFGFE